MLNFRAAFVREAESIMADVDKNKEVAETPDKGGDEDSGRKSVLSNGDLVDHMMQVNTFLENLDDYDPTLPQSVSAYHMQKAGVEIGDEKMSKLVSLAADHFLAKMVFETNQLFLLKRPAVNKAAMQKVTKKRKNSANGPLEEVFKLQDLKKVLKEEGVNLP